MIGQRFGKYLFSTLLKYNESKSIACNPTLFFKVIYDVERYKEFLPWCDESRIISNLNKTDFDAELRINFKLFTESYISRVSLKETKDSLTIVSDSTNTSVFEKLISTWEIRKNEGSDRNICDYKYEIEFKFKNLLYQQAASYFMNIITKRMSGCFEKRALELNLDNNSEQTLLDFNSPDTQLNQKNYPDQSEKNLFEKNVNPRPRDIRIDQRDKPRKLKASAAESLFDEKKIVKVLNELLRENKLTKNEFETLNHIFIKNYPSKYNIINVFAIYGNEIRNPDVRLKTVFLLREILSTIQN